MTLPNAKCHAEKKKLQHESQVTTIVGTDILEFSELAKMLNPQAVILAVCGVNC